MARLYVVYAPHGNISGLPADALKSMEAKEALLDLPDGLEGQDIYEQARKLAELLLEQIDPPQTVTPKVIGW